MVNMVPLTQDVPKELNDFRVALVAMLKDLKEGKGLSAVLGNLSLVMVAIEGMDKVPQEVKEKLGEVVALGGILGGDIIKLLTAPKLVQPIG